MKVGLATTDPLIGPERGVGTPIIGRASGDQRNVSVAYSGSSYLAVWQGGLSGATRLDAAGTVQDLTGIAIGSGESPTAVWDGTSFLVVSCKQPGVVGRRVRPDGTFVDASPFVIAEAPTSTSFGGCSSHNNGATTFVTWTSHKFVAGVGDFDWTVQGARVSGATSLDTAPITVSPPGTRPKSVPRVAFGGGNWLVVWADGRNGFGNAVDPYGARVQDATGTLLDPDGIRLATIPGVQEVTPWVASDGTDFVVSGWDTTAARVSSATGTVSLVTIRENVTTARPTVAFANGTYQFVWLGLFGLTGNRLLATGGPLDGTGVLLRPCTSPMTNFQPSVFAAGSGFYMTWLDRGTDELPVGPALFDVMGSRYSTANGLADQAGTSLTNGANAQSIVDIEGGGANGWLIVWRDTRGSAASMYAARVDPSGRSLDPAGIPLGTTYPPAVGFNGTHYLLVWPLPGVVGSGATSIVARRLDAATGQFVDPTISLTPPGTSSFTASQPDVASDGTDWFVVWTQRSPASPVGRVTGARITAAGVNLDPAGIPLNTQTAGQTVPKVAFGAGVYLTVWAVLDATLRQIIYGARVNSATGGVQDPAPAAYKTQNGTVVQSPVIVAFGGSRFVLLDEAGGVLVSPTTGAMVGTITLPSSGRPASHRLALAFDGSSLFALFDVYTGSNTSIVSLLGSRFLDDGTDLDATDFEVLAPAENSYRFGLVVAAGIPGRILVGRDNYDPNPSIAAVRVRARVVQTCGGDGGCAGPDDAGVPGDDAQPIIAPADAGPMYCPLDGSAVDGGGDGGDGSTPAEPATEAGVPDVPTQGDGGAADTADGGLPPAMEPAGEAGVPDAAVVNDAAAGMDASDAAVSNDGPAHDSKPADAAAPVDASNIDAKGTDAGGGTDGGGCGCRTAGSRFGDAWAAIAIGLALLFPWRRRPNRRSS